MAKVTDSWIKTSKELAEWEIVETKDIYAAVYEDHRVDLVEFNAQTCAKAALMRGMLAYRVDHDADTAVGFFRTGAELVAELSTAVERFRTSRELSDKPIPFRASGFELPIYVCLLANRYDLANRLAVSIALPEVLTSKDEPDYIRARVLAATVRNDLDDYRHQRMVYERLPPSERVLEPYIELCGYIIEKDEPRLSAALLSVERQFAARATKKELEDGQPIYGGPGYNDVVFDFMAVGLVKLAMYYGMNVCADSPYIPRAIVQHY